MATFSREAELQLEKQIVEQIRKQIFRNSHIIKRGILNFIHQNLEYYFAKSPTVQSIQHLGGSDDNLRRDLGLEYPEDKLETILSIMKQSFKIALKTQLNSKSGVIRVSISVSENLFTNLLLNPDALQEATRMDGSPGKEPFIPWLEWLLEGVGGHPVTNYYVKRSNPRRYGRSGEIGFMFPTWGNEKPFDIPFKHRGVEGNNFVTRILDDVGQALDSKIVDVINTGVAQALK